jgi:enhancer of polycomb-like protein
LILRPFQLDETDTRNESYICFRRREIKAIRKTQASHVTFSDKLVHLQNELATAFEITNEVIARETLKKEAAELLVDKERVPKKPKIET